MRVAFVTSDLTYPPREGLHQQVVLLLRGLRSRGVQVELLGYCKRVEHLDRRLLLRDLGIDYSSGPLVAPGPSVLTGLRNRLPWGRDQERLLGRLTAGEFDVIHLDGTAAAGLKRRNFSKITIVGLTDPQSRRQFRLARRAESRGAAVKHVAAGLAAFAYEWLLRDSRTVWHVVSASDLRYLNRRHPNQPVVSIPVSLPPSSAYSQVRAETLSSAAVIFADLRQPHMRRALRRFITDVVEPCLNDLRDPAFTVLGRIAPDEVLEEACRGLPVTFLSWVDDYEAVIQGARFVIAPDDSGTGLKNRVIQSMGLGRAVLGSKAAFEGIEVDDRVNAVIYADVQAARDGVRFLWNDHAGRAKLAARGAALVQETFGGPVVLDAWMGLYAARAKAAFRVPGGISGPTET